VEEWPLCEVLLAWHSTGFPLDKAQRYVSLRHPILINDVLQQPLLLDRREVYRILQEHNVPTPQHIVVSRTPAQVAAGEHPEGFVETPDYVAMVLSASHACPPALANLRIAVCGTGVDLSSYGAKMTAVHVQRQAMQMTATGGATERTSAQFPQPIISCVRIVS
jgi:hypothetical protein